MASANSCVSCQGVAASGLASLISSFPLLASQRDGERMREVEARGVCTYPKKSGLGGRVGFEDTPITFNSFTTFEVDLLSLGSIIKVQVNLSFVSVLTLRHLSLTFLSNNSSGET